MSSLALSLITEILERTKALNDEVRAEPEMTVIEARALIRAAREAIGWLQGLEVLVEVD
jgi:hypothetical protein